MIGNLSSGKTAHFSLQGLGHYYMVVTPLCYAMYLDHAGLANDRARRDKPPSLSVAASGVLTAYSLFAESSTLSTRVQLYF